MQPSPKCSPLSATGISYVGAAVDFLASTGHPAAKAIAHIRGRRGQRRGARRTTCVLALKTGKMFKGWRVALVRVGASLLQVRGKRRGNGTRLRRYRFQVGLFQGMRPTANRAADAVALLGEVDQRFRIQPDVGRDRALSCGAPEGEY